MAPLGAARPHAAQGVEVSARSRVVVEQGLARALTQRYEMRREAQEILPNLYLGPFQASTNLGRLRSMGIAYM